MVASFASGHLPATAGGAAAPTAGWRPAQPGYAWSFPRDHGVHPDYKTEWWYLTGQLRDDADPDRRFGFQVTFFRIGLVPPGASPAEGQGADASPAAADTGASTWNTRHLVLAHAAITHLGAGEHRFSEAVYRAIPLLGGFGTPADSFIAWCRAPAGTDDRWTLAWNGSGFDLHTADHRTGIALTLRTRPLKPRVFQGPGGYSRKGAGASAASQYVSFTRLHTTGTLTWDDITYSVHGTSWMDQEFGSNQLAEHQVGWDWFGLQLDDGRDLMLFTLRDRDGGIDFAHGTVVDAHGTPRYLAATDWSARPTRTWKSPATGARYPVAWRLRIPSESLVLDVVPRLDGQENRGASIVYWEGAVAVRRPPDAGRDGGDLHGARPDDAAEIGRGYLELTGYAEGGRPPL